MVFVVLWPPEISPKAPPSLVLKSSVRKLCQTNDALENSESLTAATIYQFATVVYRDSQA
jgi:hypothetical protein